jgi:hypothetical protein
MSPRVLSIVVGIVSLFWGALFTWTEIIDASPNQYSINSPEMKQRLANCSGNFEQRQACAEQIAEQLQQRGFLVWCKKVALILGPPLVLWTLMGVYNRQQEREPAPPPPPMPRRVGGSPESGPSPGPRRVRATAGADDSMRPDSGREPPPLDPYPQPRSGPPPGAPPHAPGTGDPAIFTGGRREPVRRRDR